MFEELITFLGVLLGCLARSILPFLRKLRKATEEGRFLKWDHRYTASFICAVLVGFVAAALVMPSISIASSLSPLIAFCTAFATGFGSNGILNELMKQMGVV